MLLLYLPVSHVRVGSRGGAAVSVLLSLFTVFPRELWGTLAVIAWEEEQRGESALAGQSGRQAERLSGRGEASACLQAPVCTFTY